MNSKTLLAITVSAGVALLVTGIVYQAALRGASASSAAETTELVVAARDLEIGSIVQATDIRLEAWPAEHVPQGSFTRPEEVIERPVVSQILAGEPVLARRLAEPGSGVGLSPKVPPGMRAMSVRVDEINGVGGFIFPEARVDVLVTGAPQGDPELGQITKTILGNVRVLSAGERLQPDSTGRPQKVPVVTLLLTPEQAELVTLAQARGKIQLVLRNSTDEQVAQTRGVREASLFGEAREVVNVEKPDPRPRPAAAAAAPPPPAPVEVEILRGSERSVAVFPAMARN